MPKSDKTWLWLAAIAAGAFIVHDLLAAQASKNAVTALSTLANRIPSGAATAATAAIPGAGATAATSGLNSLPWDQGQLRWDIPRSSRGFRN